jgi:hypothetical protein
MKTSIVTKDQYRAWLYADSETRDAARVVTIAGQRWNVSFDEPGSVSAFLAPDYGEAKLGFTWEPKQGPSKAQTYVAYRGAHARFTDTSEIAEPGLRGLAETMIAALEEARRIVAAGRAQEAAQKEAARQAALDHVAKSL